MKQRLSPQLTNFIHFSHPSDIYRFNNTVRDYKTYRDFLYQLCPKEWQEEHGKKHTKEKDLETASKGNEGSASCPTTPGQGESQGRAAPSSQGQPPALRVHLFLSPDLGRKTRTNSSSINSMSDMDAPGPPLSSRSLRLGSLQDIRPQLKKLLKPLTGKL